MKKQIKFVVFGVKWFDRTNGNTYHSVRCIRCRDGAVCVAPFQYGYGDQYRQTAFETMARAKWLPVKYRSHDTSFTYERENNYPILWTERHATKQECQANGTLI